MSLDFLLKAFRKAFPKSSRQVQPERFDEKPKDELRDTSNQSLSPAKAQSDDTAEQFDDDSVDPFNPFPDPVVLEFRDVLDLHSIPPKQVRLVVEEYLQEAYRLGFPYLRIIHGKGLGVQREMIRSILSKTPFVIEYKDAPMEAGGWGATIVTLRVKKEK
jgi:DNA-nicking Smr family endonuclease